MTNVDSEAGKYRFIVPDGLELSAEHDGGEDGEEEGLEDEEDEEDDGGGGRVGRALLPVMLNASDEVMDPKDQGVDREESYVKLK
jgi:hypothetical protein